MTMAKRWWGLEWPTWTHDGITCAPGTLEAARSFIDEHYPSIWEDEPGRFFTETMTEAKRRFLAECDVFLFTEGETHVGIAVGHPTDWSSYYMRTMAMLPAYRERAIGKEFVRRTCECAREAGVNRIETDTSPANVPVHGMMVAAGFIITATTQSDRWGVLLRYTRFLNPEAGERFRTQYIDVPTFKRRPSSR